MVCVRRTIHGIGVDGTKANRYSVAILGNYLVNTANPAQHLTSVQLPVPLQLPVSLSAQRVASSSRVLCKPAARLPNPVCIRANPSACGRSISRLMKKTLEITPNLEPCLGPAMKISDLLEDNLHVRIDLRSDALHVEGSPEGVARVKPYFRRLRTPRRNGTSLQNGELNGMLKLVTADPAVTLRSLVEAESSARPASSAWSSRAPSIRDDMSKRSSKPTWSSA